MKIRLLSTRNKLLRYIGLGMLILVLSNCEFVINSVTQPLTANAGEEITVTLDANFRIDGGPYTKRIIVGILAPKSWKLAENVKITLSGDKGTSALTLVPATDIAAKAQNGENWATNMKNRLGIGPNYIDDMEWVPFQTGNMDANNGNDLHGIFTIKMKVAVDGKNTSVKLGYIICNKDDGLDSGTPNLWPVKYAPSCLEVIGTGDLIDYCNPSLSILTPAKVLDNDYETITFDNTITTTDLKGENQIYLCATAHTADGKDITVCSQDETSRMLEGDPNKFSLTLWPRKYFNLTAAQKLISMDYFFTNKAGTKKVGYGNTPVPFTLKFLCD